MPYQRLKALCLTTIPVIFSVAANKPADNHWDTDTLAYAQSLNTTAALVVNWYGSQIHDDRYAIKPLFNETFKTTYQPFYPAMISAISLEKADLTSAENGLRFSVTGQLQFTKNGEIYQQPLSDQLHFQGQTPAAIKTLTITPTTDVIGVTDGNRLNGKGYYQSRGFAYAWLAYLNGVKNAGTWISLSNWQNNVDYRLTSGAFVAQGNLAAVLTKQQQQLGSGRYLLREMRVERPDKQHLNRGTMTLLIDFAGREDGIPTVANIQQTITYEVDDKGNWKVMQIIERHLLPNPRPWQKILC